MWPNSQFPADLVTFTEEIHNGGYHFLCCDFFSVMSRFKVIINPVKDASLRTIFA